MTNVTAVIGWTSAYFSSYPEVKFTKERREALIHRIKKRKYNFNYSDHQYLDYCAPFYADNTICILTKQEWDSVMDEAWADYPRGPRLMPEDVINRKPINTVLYEKEKWEPKDGEING